MLNNLSVLSHKKVIILCLLDKVQSHNSLLCAQPMAAGWCTCFIVESCFLGTSSSSKEARYASYGKQISISML